MQMFFSSDVKLEFKKENMKGVEGFWISCSVYKTGAGQTPWVVERRRGAP